MMCNLLTPVVDPGQRRMKSSNVANVPNAANVTKTEGTPSTAARKTSTQKGPALETPAPDAAKKTLLVRYDVSFELPRDTSTLIGRAGHCATMEDELFLQKLMFVAAAKYFL